MLVSYAQNFEDVILWRALKNVENGFYIDIGAQDPVIDSVSLSFYEKGWRGIHAEATVHYSNLLKLNRPDEEVMQAAVGDGEGTISFFEIAETGLSTCDSKIAADHREAGRTVHETQVELISLSRVFEHAGDRDIHWLKIDVEGMEASVLRSWPPSKARPWIVVVEATEPNSQMPSHEEWEDMLLGYGYIFAYFDGLSRFYVSKDQSILLKYFGPGPNFFDGFSLAETSVFVDNSRRDLALMEVKKLEEEKLRLGTEVKSLVKDLEFANAALSDVMSSISWRITAPLRRASHFIRRLRLSIVARGSLKLRFRSRRTVRLLASHAMLWLKRRPRIASPLLDQIKRFPKAHDYLRRLHAQLYAAPNTKRLYTRPSQLSPRAQAILSDINHEIDRRK